MKKEFAHLKVIEIASVLAGPSVGLFFAELGATVIKVENKRTGGDVTRSWKLPSEDASSQTSAYFSSVNWNKKSLFMDLENTVDYENLLALLKTADILIVNFKKGDAKKFNLDYSSLQQQNPQLIYGEITGFGTESDRVAYDLILQAESGFMSMNGTPSSGPVKMPVALIDLLAGHQLKAGILTALYQRDTQLKKGAYVSVSLYEAAIASLANQATNWLMGHHIAQRIGSTHPNIAPYGELFTTKDNVTITFAIGSNKQFSQLCETLKISEIAKHPDFIQNTNRIANRKALAQHLQQAVKTFLSEDLLTELKLRFVPVAKIKNMKEVFESDAAQSLILEEEVNGRLTKRVKSVVFDLKR